MENYFTAINEQISALNQTKDLFERNEVLTSLTLKYDVEHDDGDVLIFFSNLHLQFTNGLEFNFDSEIADFQYVDDLESYLEEEYDDDWILPISKKDYEELSEKLTILIKFSDPDGNENLFEIHRNNFYYDGEYELQFQRKIF